MICAALPGVERIGAHIAQDKDPRLVLRDVSADALDSRQCCADHLEHELRREVKSHQCITARPVDLHGDVLSKC